MIFQDAGNRGYRGPCEGLCRAHLEQLPDLYMFIGVATAPGMLQSARGSCLTESTEPPIKLED